MPPPPIVVAVVEVVVVVEVVLAVATVDVVDVVDVVVVVVVVGNPQLSQRRRAFRDVSLHDKGTPAQAFLRSLLSFTTAPSRSERSVARQDASASRVASHFPRSRGTPVRQSA